MNIDEQVGRIIHTYAEMIYKISLSSLKNKYDAEDIVQEVFIKYILFIKNNNFKDDNHEKNWLIRVTLNLCYNELKSAKRKKTVNYDDRILCTYSEDIGYTSEIYDLIKKLQDNYKIVFELFYMYDLKIIDISKLLNISESNVKIRLKRAKEKLNSLWNS